MLRGWQGRKFPQLGPPALNCLGLHVMGVMGEKSSNLPCSELGLMLLEAENIRLHLWPLRETCDSNPV